MDVEFTPSDTNKFENNNIKQHQVIELNTLKEQEIVSESKGNKEESSNLEVKVIEDSTIITATTTTETDNNRNNNNNDDNNNNTTSISITVAVAETNNTNQLNKSTSSTSSLNNKNDDNKSVTASIAPSSPVIESSAIESAIDSPYISSASVFTNTTNNNTSNVVVPSPQLLESSTENITPTPIESLPPTTTTTTIEVTNTPKESNQVQQIAPASTITKTTVINPDRLKCQMHRSNFIMTQIGGKKFTEMTLEQLLDEDDPQTGMGFKNPGPQGFLEYVGDTVPPPISTTTTTTTTTSNSKTNLSSSSGKVSTTGKSEGKRTTSNNTNVPASPVLAPSASPKLKSSSSSIRNSGAISGTSENGGGSGGTISKNTAATATGNSTSTTTTTNKDRKSVVQKQSTLGRLQKNEEERRKRKEQKRSRAREKPILIAGIEDLPAECQKMVKKSKIPEEKLTQHLNILLPILRFRTGYNLRHVPIVNTSSSTNSLNSSLSNKNNATTNSNNHISNSNKSPEVSTNSLDVNIINQNQTNSVQNNQINTSSNVITNVIPTTTASQSSQAPYHPSHNGNEEDDYDDGSRLENTILPKGTVDLIETDRDVKKLYKNLKQIGSGGFGSVFLAKSTVDKCEIAIKKIAHVSAKAQRTNLNEIGFLNFCKHPNIVGYLRSHLVDDTIWIAMEYMQGGTLTEASQGHTFNESCIAYVAKGMLEGLLYLHAHNIVHRDIKSGNIMMTIDGKIKIVDFGLCVDANERKLVHMAGSPFWMSPEMIRGESYSCPTDIWSFAICLLELANGEPPHRKSSLTAMFTTATEGCAGLDRPERWSEQFTQFLNLCLEMDPSKRSTAEQLLKHPWINLSENPETMKKILAQIFIANVMNHLDN
ncbi:hypothetical protein RB653_008293 [Dictyostelium firmibasis]|uniref:non-specific serine/threonine protein kinase n=1 Tax=Dictyostelium firmibasis TaxID=79012 RepID=A0AAN7TZS7_9MYCE